VRKSVVPEPLRSTLTGHGSIQTTDGIEHRLRKETLLKFMKENEMDRLKALFELNFLRAALSWTKESKIDLYTKSQKVLAETACEWVGVPVPYMQLDELTRDLTLLFDGSARTTVLHFKSRRARVRLQNWLIQMIDVHRNQRKVFTKNSPADILSALKHPHGELLTQQETAVEILNLIRPLVAISVYFVFTLHSLHAHPEYKKKIMNSNRMRRLFIQEFRRFYLFFPLSSQNPNAVLKLMDF
jgi:fatty-acid peroxygenase